MKRLFAWVGGAQRRERRRQTALRQAKWQREEEESERLRRALEAVHQAWPLIKERHAEGKSPTTIYLPEEDMRVFLQGWPSQEGQEPRYFGYKVCAGERLAVL